MALVLSNDSKKKISLFEKATPWDRERKRENENKKDKKKIVNEGIQRERGGKQEIERERQSARVRNVFPVQPWQHGGDESHVSIGWSEL